MSSIWDLLYCFFKDKGVDPFRDLLLPFLAPDKILALIGIIYVARTFNSSYRLNKISFAYQLTQAHRDIWSKIYQAKVERILSPEVDANTLTEEEKRHIIYIILNTKLAYHAYKLKIYSMTKEVRLDIGEFMNLPLPNKTWNYLKPFHEKDFVSFIDNCKSGVNARYNAKLFIYKIYLAIKNILFIKIASKFFKKRYKPSKIVNKSKRRRKR